MKRVLYKRNRKKQIIELTLYTKKTRNKEEYKIFQKNHYNNIRELTTITDISLLKNSFNMYVSDAEKNSWRKDRKKVEEHTYNCNSGGYPSCMLLKIKRV